MRFGILVFPGTWSETDCYYQVKDILGQDAEYVWHDETSLDGFDSVILPGGFSYGDYLRAGAIARDQHLLGRPRTLDEWTGRVAGVTLEAVRRFAAEHPAGPMTVVTIGPEALKPS